MTEHCRAAFDCSAKTSDGPAITVKANTLCPACIVDGQRAVDELPHLSTALKVFLGGSVKIAYESKVSSTHTPAPPMDVRIHDLLVEIGTAVDMVNGSRIIDLVRAPSEAFDMWFRGSERRLYLDGVDRVLHIRRIHKKAADAVGLHPTWQRRAAPCPECGKFELGHWAGSDTIECSDCEYKLSRQSYDDYCLEKSREKKVKK